MVGPIEHLIAAYPGSARTAGLRHFTIEYDSAERLKQIVNGLNEVERRDDGYMAHDPAGNAVLLEARHRGWAR